MPGSQNKAEIYLTDRFGVSREVNLEKINGDYWLTSTEKTGLETETRGIRAVRDMDIGLKPTTYLLQVLQNEITRNTVEISEEELFSLEEGEMIERELESKGYVALKFRDRVIGCGFYMDGLVSSRIPEGRFRELVDFIQ
ncbi:MAG: hypothetical protein ABEJ95_06775 [Candidatus Nanohalobium sp.]